ncbi:MAG: GNAT family N-acetyltransferase [Dehalococcoidia bacterium]|nr:GNAT family N-acetyltransferase [Dehalococcoidia bacterium]
MPFTLSYPCDDFGALIERLENNSRGIGIPEGFVPHSTFWLVTDEQEVVGVSNLRHALTPGLQREGGSIGYGVRPSRRGRGYASLLLKLTLEKAGAIGLRRVLLTCGKENVASARVILKNGGVLDSEEFIEERNEIVQRFWVDLAKPANGGCQ